MSRSTGERAGEDAVTKRRGTFLLLAMQVSAFVLLRLQTKDHSLMGPNPDRASRLTRSMGEPLVIVRVVVRMLIAADPGSTRKLGAGDL